MKRKYFSVLLAGLLILSVLTGCKNEQTFVEPVVKGKDITIGEPPTVSIKEKETIYKFNNGQVIDSTSLEVYPEAGISFVVPEVAAGEYFAEILRDESDQYPTIRYYTVDKESDEKIDLMYLNLDKKMPILNNTEKVGEIDGFTAYVQWPDIENEAIKIIQTIIKSGYKCEFPEQQNISKTSSMIADIIRTTVSQENATAFSIHYDLNDVIFLDEINLLSEDLRSYAASIDESKIDAYAVIIAEPADENLNVVMDGIKSYADTIVSTFENFGPTEYEIASNYQFDVVYDRFVVLVMCDNAKDVFDRIIPQLEWI